MQLSKRERTLLYILGGLVGFIILFFLILRPIYNYVSDVDRKHDSNIAKLDSLNKTIDEYIETKARLDQLNKKMRTTKEITTMIEEHAKNLNILDNKVYTRDRPVNVRGKFRKTSTDVKFEGVDITSILHFIYKMENDNALVRVSYMRINQAVKKRSLYDVTLRFDALKNM